MLLRRGTRIPCSGGPLECRHQTTRQEHRHCEEGGMEEELLPMGCAARSVTRRNVLSTLSVGTMWRTGHTAVGDHNDREIEQVPPLPEVSPGAAAVARDPQDDFDSKDPRDHI